MITSAGPSALARRTLTRYPALRSESATRPWPARRTCVAAVTATVTELPFRSLTVSESEPTDSTTPRKYDLAPWRSYALSALAGPSADVRWTIARYPASMSPSAPGLPLTRIFVSELTAIVTESPSFSLIVIESEPTRPWTTVSAAGASYARISLAG